MIKNLLMLALTVLVLLLSGCASLGIPQLDRAELASRYAAEPSRFVDIDGVRVHTRAEGSGPPVLLLHGVMASLHTWDGWAEALSDSYRVIRADIPGFGLSEAAPDFDDAMILRFVDGVLDAYGIERAIIVGNSLGGYIAAFYAAHTPERVEALTLISPAAYPQSMPWLLRLAATPVIGKGFELATPRFVVRYVLNDVYGDATPVADATVERYFELNRARGNRKAARRIFREISARTAEEPGWVADVKSPTLLLWGEQDRWIPIALARRWENDIPHAKLIAYPGVGHVAMEEIPAETAAQFRRFIAVLAAAE